MAKTISILIFSLLCCTLNAQTKETEQPFYSYFLWYDGTIGEQAIKAKISLKNGNYTVSYAYDHNKKWISLIDAKIENSTISAKAGIPTNKYTDGFIELQFDNLWNPKGQWTSTTGEKLPLTLNVALKELPASIKSKAAKNEFTPLLLNPTIVTDSINVYYSGKNDNGKKSPVEIRTYTKKYDGNSQIIYVDINYDGYLDLIVDEYIFPYCPKEQQFIMDDGHTGFNPGIGYIGAYNPYTKVFVSSHFRTIMWYKAKDGVISPYEREEYIEYHNVDHNVEISENRIRYVDGTEKYCHLDLYLKGDSLRLVRAVVTDVIGDAEII